MASKRDEDFYDDDDDEEEEEDEGDFVPGGDEEDDLDDDFEAENLDDEDAVNKEESPVLQGNLRVEGGSRIVYDDVTHGSPPYFQLVSESLPVGWSLQNPQIKEPLTFVGWILHTSNVVRFKVTTSKLDSSTTVDSIEQRFLDAQAEKDSATSGSNNSKPAAAKSGDEGDLKQQASAKAPPSYSLKQAPPASSSSEGKAPPAAGAIYVLQGSQLPDTPGESIRTFRGLFRAPSDTTRDSTFVTVAIQASEAGAAAGGAAKPAPAAAASAARKRGRDNEEEDDGDEGVGFQEVIDLHDDAGLSTDELRRRYYGGGGASADSNKKPKAVVAAAAIEDDDDDDDDDYGF